MEKSTNMCFNRDYYRFFFVIVEEAAFRIFFKENAHDGEFISIITPSVSINDMMG
jgi:hypothetical protein